AIVTPNHNWLINNGELKSTSSLKMNGHDKLWISSKGLNKTETIWTDDEIRLMGWVLTDGYYKRQFSKKTGKEWGLGRIGITQSKPENFDEISSLISRLGGKSTHTV